MIGYVYKTTNLINGKIYIGQHQSTTFNNSYFGSGTKIVKAVKKYGKSNFSVCIIHKCYKINRLSKEEKKYIKLYKSADRNTGYNIIEGELFHTKGWHHSIATKNKLKLARNKWHSSGMKGKKHSEETKKKMKLAAKYKPPVTEETKNKIRASHIGLGHTKETKEKLRNISLGQKCSKETRKKMSESAKKVVHTAEWNKHVGEALKGNKLSEETRKKISASEKGKTLSIEQKEFLKAAIKNRKRDALGRLI